MSTYDSMIWVSLDYMVNWLGFDDTWRKWVKAVVCSSRMFVLVNGNPTMMFQDERGLTQGGLVGTISFLDGSGGVTWFGREGKGDGRF